LHRLRRTLYVPAVFAAAIAVSATALAAPTTHGMQRFVWVFRQQRRVPGRWVWLAYGLVFHASAVRLWHRLHRLRTALLFAALATAALATALSTAALATAALATAALSTAALATAALSTAALATVAATVAAPTITATALLPARLPPDQRPKHRLRHVNGRAARPHNWW